MSSLQNTDIHPRARFLAYDSLYSIFGKGAYANLTIQKTLRNLPIKKEERHLYTELVYGVCRRYNYLLWVIARLSTRPIKKIHLSVRILLCLGLYQLIFLDRIPESAAVNETVRVAKKVTHLGNRKFVNGILRSFLRQKEIATLPIKERNPILYMSLYYNQQEWLLRRWLNAWGKEKTESVLKAFNTIPVISTRCNTLKISPSTFEDEIKKQGIVAEKSAIGKEAFLILSGSDIFFSHFVNEGLAYVQAESSMIPMKVLAPQKGDRLLDMCAAPGSKTTQAAQMMGNTGRISAWDLYPHKIRLIENNAQKLGITNIETYCRDGRVDYSDEYGKYDKVLLDAPCSGLGVLGHKTELRWTRTEDSLHEFPLVQMELLEKAAHYVRPGGILVYSTCTLNKAENEDVVNAFLGTHREYTKLDFKVDGVGKSKEGMMTIYPDSLQSDGFFVARLKRRS